MNISNFEKYFPLDSIEMKYKHLYIEHPEFNLDTPSTLSNFDNEINKLNGYNNLYKLDPSGFSPNDILLENIIPATVDVAITKHSRYSPAFLHRHNFFEISYVLNGSCKNQIADKMFTMKKGDICIIAPNINHGVSVFSDNSIVINLLVKSSTFEKAFWNVLINKDILSSFFSRALYSSMSLPYLFFNTQNDSVIENVIINMYEEFNYPKLYSKQMVDILVSSFFITLLRNYGKSVIIPNPAGNKLEANIITILNYIDSNYQDITLKKLSVFFNYSERQMTRILKDYTGQTFINIIQDIKIQKARELLVNSQIPIQKIIDIIGYSNNSHFYNIFKKYYNMTPFEYRNTNTSSLNN